jgi:hypothetical protein
MAVFVLDKYQRPLMPCSEKRARLLLTRRKACVHSIVPFTARLVHRTADGNVLQPVRYKSDLGSKNTGLTIVKEEKEEQVVLAFFELLKESSLPCEEGTGAQTKYNHMRFGIPKMHALDAACTGYVGNFQNWQMPIQPIFPTGRGTCQRTLDRFGFPRGFLMREKQVHALQTGDLVIASVSTDKNKGSMQAVWPSEPPVISISKQERELSKALATDTAVLFSVLMGAITQSTPLVTNIPTPLNM